MTNQPRPEYPRPDFARKHWLCLNGEWDFSFDAPTYDTTILVPFCYQAKASGIGSVQHHDTVWYRRTFPVEPGALKGHALLLHFGAVDYEAGVWVNGIFIGRHTGGHSSFCFDITHAAREGDNTLEVRADDYQNTDKPRGKQSWRDENFGCWYTPTTGIWQSVWLEYAGETYLRRLKTTPDLAGLEARFEFFLSGNASARVTLEATIEKEGGPVFLGRAEILCQNGYGKAALLFEDLDFLRDELVWSPEHPNLIDVAVTVHNEGTPNDEVTSYFGLRQAGTWQGKTTLNHDAYYQRLVLDQGYWPDTLLTPPSDDAIVQDILLTKEMGFNGARKHQKIEDPRYYYWADKLGLLVWGELPSAYLFNDTAIGASAGELMEFIQRDYNHPCIVAWVPVNESWGVRNALVDTQQQDYTRALLYLIKAMDPTRPVSANDGWEQPSETDLCALHDYSLIPQNLSRYDDPEALLRTDADGRTAFAQGNEYKGQPLLLTEYGGIAFLKDTETGWGYNGGVADEEAFLARLGPVTSHLVHSGRFAGFCYTQLTDVMQEKNGLLHEDRTPKLPTEKLRAVFEQNAYLKEKPPTE